MNKEDKSPDDDGCPICFSDVFTSRTRMDTCSHEFCYPCLSSWLKKASTCPTCRKEPIVIIVNAGKSNERSCTLETLKKEKSREQERRVAADPMISEREILNKRKHELNRIINLLETIDGRAEENMRRDAVIEKNGIQLLLDGIAEQSTTRQEVVSSPQFRALIYKFNCIWTPIGRNIRVRGNNFTPRVAKSETHEQKTQILNFISNELFVLPAFLGKEEFFKIVENRRLYANKIFGICVEHQIHSPNFRKVMNEYKVVEDGCIERFQHELFEFASSRMSMAEFMRTSSYKLPPNAKNRSDSDILVNHPIVDENVRVINQANVPSALNFPSTSDESLSKSFEDILSSLLAGFDGDFLPPPADIIQPTATAMIMGNPSPLMPTNPFQPTNMLYNPGLFPMTLPMTPLLPNLSFNPFFMGRFPNIQPISTLPMNMPSFPDISQLGSLPTWNLPITSQENSNDDIESSDIVQPTQSGEMRDVDGARLQTDNSQNNNRMHPYRNNQDDIE